MKIPHYPMQCLCVLYFVWYYLGFPIDAIVDFETQFIMGHSAGSHVACDFLKINCHKMKGLIHMSPVDGVDPFGITPLFCTREGRLLNYELPQIILAGGLDSVVGKIHVQDWNIRPRKWYAQQI